MKALSVLAISLLIVLSGSSLAGAQSYEGTSLEEGIYYVPADVGPGSVINFAAEGLVAESEVQIRLVDENGTELDGLTEVQGVVVVRTDSAGNLNSDVRLPDVDGGTYTILVEGTKADLTPFVSQLSLQIADEPASSAAAGSDTAPASLALTGSETQSRLFGGVVLVALGMGLVFVASRRREEVPVG